MSRLRWLIAVPVAVAALVGTAPGALAASSAIRDKAGLFSRDAIRQAQAILDKTEAAHRVPTVIETIDSLDGEPLRDAAVRRAQESGIQGVFVLVTKAERKIYVSDFRRFLGEARREQIDQAFIQGFKKGDFDAGLIAGAEAVERQVASAPPVRGGRNVVVPRAAAPVGARGQGNSGMAVLLTIGAVVLGGLFLSRLFRSRTGPGYGPGGYDQGPGPMAGGPGMGGYGPGGMGGGYGGGYGQPQRGGFWSGVMGGLGGAVAGNWLYDQFSGRSHNAGQAQDYTTGAGFMGGDPGAGSTGNDWGGTAGDWGGNDAAGGAGGGDWGGGGGDWGGGGGDSGGGDWG